MDASRWEEYGREDVELKELLRNHPSPKSFADFLDATSLRQYMQEYFTSLITTADVKSNNWIDGHTINLRIPTRDGALLRSVVYAPKDAPPGPLCVYFHGGGWTFGAPEAGEALFEDFVKRTSGTVVSVGYRLAPEHVFPTAALDAWDAVKWCAENASLLRVDLAKGFVVAGSSAGANIAAVAAHEAVDARLEPRITGMILMSPSLCHYEALPEDYKAYVKSWKSYEKGLVLDQRGMKWLCEQYKPDPKSPLASPLLWPSHSGQPKTYMQIMGTDMLRDEALVYSHVLREAGVKTRVDVYPGIPHGGPDFFPKHSVGSKALTDLAAGMTWVLKD